MIGVRVHHGRITVGDVYARERRGKPAVELRRPHYVGSPHEAATVVLAAVAQATRAQDPTTANGGKMQLALLEPNPSAEEFATRIQRWRDPLRAQVRLHYRDWEITADEVWTIMADAPEHRIPDGTTPNVMGSFFTGWAHAERTGGFRRSTREGAHGNLLAVWRIS